MGRPVKSGLDYFPVDTDIFEDDKISYVSAKHGLIAEAIAFRLLCKIYKNGGFMLWNEDSQILFSYQSGKRIAVKKVIEIVTEFIGRGFFDLKMFEKYSILTSNGIQKRYISVCKLLNRKISLSSLYIISSEETISQPVINSEETTSQLAVNSEKGTQTKRKEIKGNEIKLKENDKNGTDFTKEGRELLRAVTGDK